MAKMDPQENLQEIKKGKEDKTDKTLVVQVKNQVKNQLDQGHQKHLQQMELFQHLEQKVANLQLQVHQKHLIHLLITLEQNY